MLPTCVNEVAVGQDSFTSNNLQRLQGHVQCLLRCVETAPIRVAMAMVWHRTYRGLGSFHLFEIERMSSMYGSVVLHTVASHAGSANGLP